MTRSPRWKYKHLDREPTPDDTIRSTTQYLPSNILTMELTRTKKVLMLLTCLVQSSIGLALSLAYICTYSERISVLVTEKRGGEFFRYFCISGFVINGLLLVVSLVCITVQVAELILTRGAQRRRRGLYQREGHRVYGAFGYYSVI